SSAISLQYVWVSWFGHGDAVHAWITSRYGPCIACGASMIGGDGGGGAGGAVWAVRRVWRGHDRGGRRGGRGGRGGCGRGRRERARRGHGWRGGGDQV